MTNLIEEQIKLEQEGVTQGIQQYRKELKKAQKNGSMSDMAPGMALLTSSIEPMREAIDQFTLQKLRGAQRTRQCQKFLKKFDSTDISYIVCRSIIDIIGSHAEEEPLQRIAIKIINRLIDHYDYTRFKKENPNYLHHLEKQLNKRDSRDVRHRRIAIKYAMTRRAGMKETEWSDVDKVHVGAKIIELCIEATGLIKKEQNEGNSQYTLVPTPEVLEWLEDQHARCELLQPFFLPMVIEPLPWQQGLYDGGFISQSSSRYRLPIVRTRNKQTLNKLEHTDLSNVRKVLNTLQATKWRINKDVYKIMEQVWQAGGVLGGLPQAEDEPLPLKPWGNMNDDEFEDFKMKYPEVVKGWKQRATDVYDRRRRNKSKRIALAGKLYVAELMQKYDKFYFVWNCDWRGRLYPVATYVHPQGDDSGKALIEFAEGKPLGKTGARWLKIHLANTYGNDKISLNDRCKWVESVEREVLLVASDPLGLGKSFWQEADKPFQFLAACLEYRGYKMEGEGYVSHLPVAMDGSCNGLQNLSAMLKDEIGGKAVNLIPSNKPQDVYMQVANRLIEKLEEDDDPMADVWKGKIDRKLVKRPVMTVPYGVTQLGIREQLMGEVKDRSVGTPYLDYEEGDFKPCVYLAKLLHEAIGEIVIASRGVMDWLKDIAKVLGKNGLGVHWKTPKAGFLCNQHYNKENTLRINTYWGLAKIRVRLAINKETDKLDTRKQALGISPNFVHSYDASHLMLTVLAASEEDIKDFCMIHDSYAAHACDSDKLARILREQFINLYSQNVLEDFREQILGQIPSDLHNDIPEVPLMGRLDIGQVINSEYFFA